MQSIILDVDSAGDAIAFAAAHPGLRLDGVTTVSGAAGGVIQATHAALNALVRADRENVPVHAGAWRPIVGNAKADRDAAISERRTIDPPVPKRPPNPGHAVDFIIDMAMASPGAITLVMTGPLTNAAMALLQEPNLSKTLKQVIVSGGAFAVPGNVTPVSEYNIWADPEAARLVLHAAIDTILVPLDVFADDRSAAGAFAVALACQPDLAAMTEERFVDVVLDGRLARGQTVAFRGRSILGDGGPKTTRVCTGLDRQRFMTLFKTTTVSRLEARS